MKRLTNLSKRERYFFLIVAVILLVAVVLIIVGMTQSASESSREEITVTQEEIQSYREMIGDGMDEKRAVFILFNSEEECKAFISEHGADEHPEALGIGVVPMLSEDGYHNIVGKTALEEAFNNLADGEYAKEPVLYADKFCYLKRISCVSPISDDETLRQMIQEDKINQGKGEPK